MRGASFTGLSTWPPAELDELWEVANVGGVALFLMDFSAGPHAGRYIIPVFPSPSWREVVRTRDVVIPLSASANAADSPIWRTMRAPNADYLSTVSLNRRVWGLS